MADKRFKLTSSIAEAGALLWVVWVVTLCGNQPNGADDSEADDGDGFHGGWCILGGWGKKAKIIQNISVLKW